jgi:hypothetical protein
MQGTCPYTYNFTFLFDGCEYWSLILHVEHSIYEGSRMENYVALRRSR